MRWQTFRTACQIPDELTRRESVCEPMLGKIGALPEDLGAPETVVADAGYFSAANVAACATAGVEPPIAMGRQRHHPPLAEGFETAPPAPKNPTPVEAMAHRLNAGREEALRPAQTPSGAGALADLLPAQDILRFALGRILRLVT